jgi:Family of unknown function (DUF5681)
MNMDGDALPESEPARSVGYGQPPETTRFKKGRSGNPKGRPQGSANVATILAKTLREKVVINENGRRRTVTKLQAAVKQLVNKAASGELRALVQLMELAQETEAKQSTPRLQDSDLNELDHEVMQGILQRFQVSKNQNQLSEEKYPNEPESR